MSTATWTERFHRAEPALRRAPSAHNTQPWTVQLTASGWTIGWDADRELVVGDPTRRDLWLSLGAFTESAVIALGEQGVSAAVEYLPAAAGPGCVLVTEAGGSAGTGARAAATASDGENPFTAGDLLDRRTARGEYRPAGHGDIDLRELMSAARAPGTLTPLPGGFVRELLTVAEPWSYRNPALVAELRRWLRLNRRDSRYRQDGLSDAALGLSRWQALGLRVALSAPVWAVLRRIGGPRLLAAAAHAPAGGSVAVFAVPAAQAAEPADMIERGRELLRLWLAAGRRGWRVHPLSVLLDCPATRRQLTQYLNADRPNPNGDNTCRENPVAGASNLVPLAVFRIGTPLRQPELSTRRPVPVRQPPGRGG